MKKSITWTFSKLTDCRLFLEGMPVPRCLQSRYHDRVLISTEVFDSASTTSDNKIKLNLSFGKATWVLLRAQAARGRHWLYPSLFFFPKTKSEAGTTGSWPLTVSSPFYDSNQTQCFDKEALEESTTTSASLCLAPAALCPPCPTASCPQTDSQRRADKACTHESDLNSPKTVCPSFIFLLLSKWWWH